MHGFLLISIDLPCHGTEHRSKEPQALAGWAYRCEQGKNFVKTANARLSKVLDYLISSGHCDVHRIAACGTSRGGYLALQFAAHEPRVNAVAAFAPVTELTALREFQEIKNNAFVLSLGLQQQAQKLAGRPVWIIIGDRDLRVGTDHAISFARSVTKASLEKKPDSKVELHVIAEPRGHTVPKGAAEQSAVWMQRYIKTEDLTENENK